MNITRNKFLSCLVITLMMVSHLAFSQQKELDTLVDKFDQYRKNSVQEKIYVHLDRNFYLTGETIWFKVYSVDGTVHKPLSISKVVYIEILDDNHNTVLQSKVGMQNGFGEGSVFIPASINSATFTFRAYTQWMKNFSPEFFFHKGITIVNPFIKIDHAKAADKKGYDAKFFPEGGNLIAGVKSKIGFRITDATGAGVDCRGAVINEQGDTITSFKTLRSGIGNFFFTPGNDAKEKVVIIDKSHQASFFKLPDAYAEGYVMQVTDSLGFVRVAVHNRLPPTTTPYIYLFVHSRQIIAHAEVQPAFNKTLVFSINKNKLPEGITHLTLFDGRLKPICERLYFKYPTQMMNITAQADAQQYGIRRKVQLNITTAARDKTIPANVSVSIYKLDSLATAENTGIFDYLWLKSDLTGNIESPEYYFTNDPNAAIAMDNLMLTHGWRKFNWDDILNKKATVAFIPEYRGHIIHGRVRDENGAPVYGSHVFLSSPDKIIRVYPATSIQGGELNFETINFRGTRQIVVQAVDSTHKIEIESPLATSFSSYRVPALNLSASLENALLSRSIAMQVQDVYYENYRSKYSTSFADSSGFYGKADETYYLDAYTRFPVMEEVMREYVPGVMVRKRRDGFHFIVIDHIHKIAMMQTPLILLNGVPIFDADKIMAFDPRKVRKLEVMTRPYYLGPHTFAGIVSYTTYSGEMNGFQFDPNAVVLDYDGLQLEREFMMPQYDNQKQRSNPVPDYRTILFWAPNVITDRDGKQQLEFFTSDIEGKYMVKIEGLSENGSAGTGSTTFSVKRFNN